MSNTPERVEFWKEFICTKCQFPEPEKLRAQFAVAAFSEFCDCGCNSFKVQVLPTLSVAPIANKGGYGSVFEVSFQLADQEGSLEVIIFADEYGNLAYVEIDCCANSFPVPEIIKVIEPPYHLYANDNRAL